MGAICIRAIGLLSATAVAGLPLAGCGGGASSSSSTAAHTNAPSGVATGSCHAVVAATLGRIAKRIYDQAAGGRNVAEAVGRLQHSPQLIAAVSSDNAAATASALRALLLRQIVHARVTRGARTLADVGASAPALAPVRGQLSDASGRPIGSFVLSVQETRSYLSVTRRVTGGGVLVRPAGRPFTGTLRVPAGDRPYSFAAEAYPSGPLRVTLLVAPPAPGACGTTAAQTAANTIGQVGVRIYQGELAGAEVRSVLELIERSTAFREAAAAGDAPAARAAIVGFFQSHIHVVRVRVMRGPRLLVDAGGPYVLAPVTGTLRDPGGHVIATFQMAIQDDAGYMKLAHLFTGAEVLMRVGARQVMGTLNPGPQTVPDRGTVSYGGTTYRVYSFVASAFPSGALRISLLVRSG